jgi:hypothetical protein
MKKFEFIAEGKVKPVIIDDLAQIVDSDTEEKIDRICNV